MKSIYERFTKRTLLFILVFHFSVLSFAATYYVSNTGNNSNSGLTTALAWQTISKVNTTVVAGDIVLLNRGDVWYEILETNVDGNASNHITFGAYGTGANPKISGLSELTSWTSAGGGIYYASLAVTNLNMVTIDGVARGMGRYPDSGYLSYESHTANTSITDNQLTGTPNWTGAEIGIRKVRWIIDRHTVTSQSTSTLNYNALQAFGNNTAYAPVNGNGYFFQNDIKCLDDFGDWCFDAVNGRVYIYFGAETPTTYVIKASSVIYNAKGRSYSYYNNIDFEGANRIGYYESGGHSNMHFTDCNFINQGGNALYAANSSYLTITGGSISTAFNTGVHFEGGVPNVTIDGLTVSHCGDILGSSKSGDAAGIGIYIDGDNAIIRNCSVTNSGYHGIYFNGNNALVENNFVDSFCKVKDDGGGIYTYTSNASIIRNNIVLNAIGSYAGAQAYSWEAFGKAAGIYLDDGTTTHNATVTGNTLSTGDWGGIFVNDNGSNKITNNLIFDFRYSLHIIERSVGNIRNMIITGNKFIAKTSTQMSLYNEMYVNESPSLFGVINNNYYTRPIDDNLTIQTKINGGDILNQRTLDGWKTYSGQDVYSLKSTQAITSANDLLFNYNASAIAKTVSLTQPMIDVVGTKYSANVTVQPFASVVLMKDLTAAVVPGPPISVVATVGNASASVTFAAPVSNGGSAITGYTVTSIPAGGTDTNAGSTSLIHTITGLTNGTSYTFTVKATNSVGTSVGSVASNSVIPKSPATTFTFTGPFSGNVNSSSSNFTVTPNNLYTGTITITPSGTGSAGLSSKVLTFSNSATAQTFTISPTVAGSITLTPTNNGTLTNAANITYTANAVVPDAPVSVVAASGDASVSVTFMAPTNTGGSSITGYTVTSIPAGGTDLNAGSPSLTHSITGLANGTYTFTVKAINSVGSSVASVASNPVENIIIKQGEIIPSHFTTVWQGLNGLNHMNINVVSALLEDLPLSADDEIAVFSGSACVGTSKLTQSIVPSDNSTFLTILASQNNGSGNGFIDNDTIVFKIWNSKTQNELQVNAVVYRNDVSTWKTNGRYSPGATTVVEIASYQVYTQSIELLKGYNMISTYLSAQNPNVSNVTKTLLDQGNLIKMQDETGNSFENWGSFGGWINQLGSIEETEGYKIQVANNCTLHVTGRSIAMPFDISLKTGWNIISFPRTDVVNAMNVVQSLINQNKLVKVQDEAGNSIENWGLFGGWKNGIGNFIPGKAYKVKMSADAILTLQESYPKSALFIAKAEQNEYYHSSVEGNGTDHMNINITGLNNTGLSAGDELAAFDGSVCVASIKISEANLVSGSASLASSFSTDNQNPNGFKVGDPIKISAWNKLSGDESTVNVEVLTGQLKYEKNATVLVKMKSAILATAVINLNDAVKIDVFPNPCQGRVTVRFSEIPEANSRIEISDVSGRKLISRIVSGTTEEFSLDSFTPGLYLVKTILGTNEFIHKLIVNK